MANKNSNLVKEDELKKAMNQAMEGHVEILVDAPGVDDEDFEDDEPEEDKKFKVTFPKWLVTTGKVFVGVMAAIGTGITGLLIYDKVKTRKKAHYTSIPVQRREALPDYTTHQTTDTFNTEFKDLATDLGTDVKIEI